MNMLLRIFKHPHVNVNKIYASIIFILLGFLRKLTKNKIITLGIYWIDNIKLIGDINQHVLLGNLYFQTVEYRDINFLRDYLKKDDIFFDLGANIGLFSLIAAKKDLNTIIAVEPANDTYEQLNLNLSINNFSNVKTLNFAIGKEKTTGILVGESKETRRLLRNLNNSDENFSQQTQVETIDTLSQNYGFPDIIKMDLEGHETDALYGAINTLENKKEIILICETGDHNEAIFHKFLISMDFKAYVYDPKNKTLSKSENKLNFAPNRIYFRNSALNKIRSRSITIV